MSSFALALRGPALLLALLAAACSDGTSGGDGGAGNDARSALDAQSSVDVNSLDTRDAAARLDAQGAGDSGSGSDVATMPEAAAACGCSATEVCGDGFDNNCDGHVDEHCACLPNTTQRCLSGTPHPGAPLCAFGQQACVGSGEFGEWGECTGMGSHSDAATSDYGCRRIVVIGAPGANPSSNFQSWLEGHGAIVQRVQTTATDGPLQRALLDTFDVAIIDWLQRTYTADEATVLRDWVLAGGGLIALSGHDSGATADRHVSLLQAVGINYRLGTAYSGPATFTAGPLSAVPGSTHTIAPVSFYGGLEVLAEPGFSGASASVATVPGGTVVGVTGDFATPDQPHRGRVFVFGDEWIEFDSEWSTMPDLTQLWVNSISWVNPTVAPAPDGCE